MAFLFVSISLFANGQGISAINIANIYTSQIGVREATGRNDGKTVETYLASVNRVKGDAWCAAFVHWTLQQAGINNIPKSGWSPAWFPADKTVYKPSAGKTITPQKADVFGIYFNSMKRIAHVGFIDQWIEGQNTCITVEGNTNDAGSREGDGVYKKRRLKKQIYAASRWVNNCN